MKNSAQSTLHVSQLVSALVLSLVPGASALDAWTTISDSKLGGGALAMIYDSGGTVLIDSGTKLNSAGQRLALARMSTDGGVGWSELDAFLDSGFDQAGYRGIACDANNQLYACGYQVIGGTANWLIRETDSQGTWWTVENFPPSLPATYANCAAIQISPWGEVFAAGTVGANWTVRRKRIGVDAYYSECDSYAAIPSLNDGHSALGIGFLPASQGTDGKVLVVGYQYNLVGAGEWLVRKSDKFGDGPWTGNTPFPSKPGTVGAWSQSAAYCIGVDINGAIYVAGHGVYQAKRTISTDYLLVMRSIDGGESWSIVDQFSYGSKRVTVQRHRPWTVVCAAGGVWVCGYIDCSGSVGTRWFVRKGILSSTGTISWSMSDDFQFSPGQGSGARAIVLDPQGYLLVAGSGTDATGVEHSIVRRLSLK